MELLPSDLAGYTLENYLLRISTRTRIIYWMIIAGIAVSLAVLPFIYVDVPDQAGGYFQSDIEKQIISSPFPGRVVFASVDNGRKVSKGDTLLIIESDAEKARMIAILERINENNLAIDDLGKLTSPAVNGTSLRREDFRTERYFSEYSSMMRERKIRYQKYSLIKAAHERNATLHTQKIIPDNEFENSLYSLRTEEENLNHVLAGYKTGWQSDIAERKIREGELIAEMEKCGEEIANRVVTTPGSGEILMGSGLRQGSLVAMNQHIAEISPEGRLVACCFVRRSDIGLVWPQQKVRIQVDAFNYNEWGLLDATILDVSDDLIMVNGSEPRFRVRCLPVSEFMSRKGGPRAELKKGMSFNARIIVTRRTLFRLLLDKTDDWMNPFSDQKEQSL